MQCQLSIDQKAIAHNFQLLRTVTGTDLCPVLKSNGYGHGIDLVYRSIESLSPRFIAVAYLEEAEILRKLGYKGRILLVTPLSRAHIADAFNLGVDCFLNHLEQVEWFKGAHHVPSLHLKVDTGLTRQGWMEKEIKDHIDDLQSLPLVGVCTHFANVEDVLEHEYADLQLSRFSNIRTFLRQHQMKLIEHSASSASALLLPQSRFDMCRPGISLYGYWPSHLTKLSYLQLNQKMIELRPALRWTTTIAQIKDVAPGTFIGYGCTFKATVPMKVAVLPVGYFEGYSRMIANAKSYVLIQGKRCSIVGRISMNMMVVDISQVPSANMNDEVVLLGKQNQETISAETLAEWAGTIQYEFLTRLHRDIPRLAN